MGFKCKVKSVKLKVYLIIIFLITYHLSLITSVQAQEGTIGYSQIHPASPLYFLKSVREIFELKLAGTTQVRALRELEFSTRRVKEVKSLVKTSNQDLIEPTLEKYWSSLQDLWGLINLKDEITAAQISESVTLHMSVLQAAYNQVSDPLAKRSLRVAINRLSGWEQRLIVQLNSFNKYPHAQQVTASKLSACNLLAKEASSSALNEVERFMFGSRSKVCFESLIK